MKFLTAVLGLLVISAVACKKDKGGNSGRAEMVTGVVWKIDTMGVDITDDGKLDLPLPIALKPCELDNTLTFYADSTAVFSESALKCDQDDPSIIPFEWYLKENDNVIFIDGNIQNLQGDVKIIQLTETSFILSKAVAGLTGKLILELNK